MDKKERLHQFLRLFGQMQNGYVPENWNDELRVALSDNLVKIGFGGSLQLTEAGRIELTK